MTDWLIGAALIGAALVWVALPLRRGPSVAERPDERSMHDAAERKRVALDAIVELEDERDVGKLSEGDFASLRTTYEDEAIAALRHLDSVGAPAGTPARHDDAIEAEIAAARARLACPRCGTIRESAEVCPRCGA
ncbi:MAG: hypothetical protein M3345_03220 [Actinomycetota bacterium]|nr:hypothetical protein [Actinomycetota bacterium]